MTVYGIWEFNEKGKLVKIDSFFDRDLALRYTYPDEPFDEQEQVTAAVANLDA